MTLFIKPFGKLVLAKLQFLHCVRIFELNVLTKYLEPHAGETILDVGSGKGFYCGFLKATGCNPTGIEPTPREVAFAQTIQDPTIPFLVGMGEELPFSNGKFDKVVSVCVLEHTKDDQKVLKECFRVLKKEGVFVLSVDALDNPHFDETYKKIHAMQHFVNQYYTREKLVKMLGKAGFDVEASQYLFGSPLSTYVMRVGGVLHFGLWFLLAFPILYPILWVDQQMNPQLESGMILVLKAVKK
ncbi:MAG: class I SAM-dependent methyltransferase [Candidatus Diapherotrites archaeon]